jgi:hypothetical protein
MSKPPFASPFELLAKLAPKSTAEDDSEARRLGITIDEYRALKLEAQFKLARDQHRDSTTPADIKSEQAKAASLRSQPGVFKSRNQPPGLLTQAARTPGEVARMILFVICYLVSMILLIVLGGETAQRLPGIFQCVVLAVLIFPTAWLTNRIWEAVGENTRDVIRTLVRFWPLTLIGLIFALGLLRLLIAGSP